MTYDSGEQFSWERYNFRDFGIVSKLGFYYYKQMNFFKKNRGKFIRLNLFNIKGKIWS